jgi:hypothetical protein
MSEEMVQISIPKSILERMQKALDKEQEGMGLLDERYTTPEQYFLEIISIEPKVLFEMCGSPAD